MPTTLEAVAVLLLAIVPGFVATTTWSRARTWRGPGNDVHTVLESLALSVVVQVVAAPLTIWWILPERTDLLSHPERIAAWLVVVVLVLPVVGGLAASKASDSVADLKEVAPTGWRGFLTTIWPAAAPPSIWDWLFTSDPPHGCFVMVEFTDGRRVAGVFAEGSLAGTSPEPHGLYLVSEWVVNEAGDIVGPVPSSRGLMIRDLSAVRQIRILAAEEEGEVT